MQKILDRIKKSKILVGDGAMGTMLFQRGLKQGEPPESICLNKPEVLEEIAKAYLDAGADILIVGRYITQSRDVERSVENFLPYLLGDIDLFRVHTE